MLVGRLSTRFNALKKHTTQDSYGQAIVEWQDIGGVWGALSYKQSKEAVAGGAILENNQVSIRLRADKKASQLTQNDALKDKDGNFYSINGVFPEMASRAFIDFVCEVGTLGEDNNNG